MEKKFRVIYFNLDANTREYLQLADFDYKTLEEAEKSLNSIGLGNGLSKSSSSPLDPHSDQEALEVQKIEIWQLNEYGDPIELVKSLKK